MQPLLLTTTEDGTGKTSIALALAQLASQRDLSIGYMKPKGTRLQSHLGKTIDQDPVFAAELLGLDEPIETLEPIVYSPTFIQGVLRGHDDPKALRDRVIGSIDTLAEKHDLLIVEGGGDLDVGAILRMSDPELASLIDARTVLTATYQEPSDVDQTVAAARRFDDHLEGILFNAIGDSVVDELEADVASYLEAEGIGVLGVIPRLRELAGVTVDQLANELGGELLSTEGTDRLVERFLIGAMGREAASAHLRRTRAAAVITGGDRADIQSIAIEAPGVECLILTGSMRPSEAIIGRATSAGMPVLLCAADTRTIVDRAEAIVRSGRTRDVEAVELMRSLLEDHTDVDALLGHQD